MNSFPRLVPCFLHVHIASDCPRLHRARDTCTCLTLRSLQARGKSQEAAREVRALLDLMCENEASVQKWAAGCAAALKRASMQLTILDPEVGEEELIQAVAAALANLRLP